MIDRLHPDDIEAIAQRVVVLLGESRPPDAMLEAQEVAEIFGVKRQWVYDNQQMLGAVRIGNGPKGHLRFDPAKVAEVLTPCSDSRQSEPPKPAGKANNGRRRRPSGSDDPALLPIRQSGGPE